ncbi:hypothetical protein SERLA73DRAFT_146704 [Serpula lacrymans var. lacrymans S7.3]|uniref:Uncharacterized protein n=2 Tax=Serpula lacrymans var. lacrymans TaxID=341189 RepID=F8QG42_SERL3|nr:uncharacterized protein SERLADRAFT_385129 [Serpula lacrymans var. lacrymans S7.9]EGN92790.1 hypothetical protein SERLA73DRAFT_146704 [Serpula lacrymans var. lacrymans S7.3]EGO26448.1 hypothetical protein SERLADRAFT_385129 [Serpula lacrymans var. lacrymans S7.9]
MDKAGAEGGASAEGTTEGEMDTAKMCSLLAVFAVFGRVMLFSAARDGIETDHTKIWLEL